MKPLKRNCLSVIPLLHVLLKARRSRDTLPGILVVLGIGITGVGHAAGTEFGLLGGELEVAGERGGGGGGEGDGGGGEEGEEGGGELEGEGEG